MGNYAKISPIRRSQSIPSYQDGDILFKLIEIGHIPYGACKKLEMSLVDVDFSVKRGGKSIAGNSLDAEVTKLLKSVPLPHALFVVLAGCKLLDRGRFSLV